MGFRPPSLVGGVAGEAAVSGAHECLQTAASGSTGAWERRSGGQRRAGIHGKPHAIPAPRATPKLFSRRATSRTGRKSTTCSHWILAHPTATSLPEPHLMLTAAVPCCSRQRLPHSAAPSRPPPLRSCSPMCQHSSRPQGCCSALHRACRPP